MIEYVAGAQSAVKVGLWVTAGVLVAHLVLVVLVLVEIRRYTREEDERHAEFMRRLAERRAQDERRHAEFMRGLATVHAAPRGPG